MRDAENKRRLAREQYQEWRQRVVFHMGGVCAKCDATEGLHVDHVEPTTKSFNVSHGWTSRPWSELVEELKKCQLLCGPHHREKTAQERAVPHGGGVTGKHGCKCDPCRLKKNEYLRELKRRKRRERSGVG